LLVLTQVRWLTELGQRIPQRNGDLQGPEAPSRKRQNSNRRFEVVAITRNIDQTSIIERNGHVTKQV